MNVAKIEAFTNVGGVVLGTIIAVGMIVGSGFNMGMFKALVYVALLNYGP